MNFTLVERAAKIQADLQNLPSATIRQHQQFFDDVWMLCGAVIDADASSDGGQSVPPSLLQ
jgi:hypothetical protein